MIAIEIVDNGWVNETHGDDEDEGTGTQEASSGWSAPRSEAQRAEATTRTTPGSRVATMTATMTTRRAAEAAATTVTTTMMTTTMTTTTWPG